jgi:flagellar export protein FliJ
MKPFKFRLERLKKVRSAEERAARAAFAAALGALTRKEAALRDSLLRRDAAREELRHILAAGSSASSFLTAQRVTDRFDGFVEEAEQERVLAASAADHARAKWATLRAKDEGLSRLRAARESEHRRESERSHARELDEIAMTRAAGNGKPADRSSATTTPSS